MHAALACCKNCVVRFDMNEDGPWFVMFFLVFHASNDRVIVIARTASWHAIPPRSAAYLQQSSFALLLRCTLALSSQSLLTPFSGIERLLLACAQRPFAAIMCSLETFLHASSLVTNSTAACILEPLNHPRRRAHCCSLRSASTTRLRSSSTCSQRTHKRPTAALSGRRPNASPSACRLMQAIRATQRTRRRRRSCLRRCMA